MTAATVLLWCVAVLFGNSVLALLEDARAGGPVSKSKSKS
jgi:hypothetical protein